MPNLVHLILGEGPQLEKMNRKAVVPSMRLFGVG